MTKETKNMVKAMIGVITLAIIGSLVVIFVCVYYVDGVMV